MKGKMGSSLSSKSAVKGGAGGEQKAKLWRAEETARISAIRPQLAPFVFEEAPENVLEEIAERLDDASLASFALTCSRIRAICTRVSSARPLFRFLSADPRMGPWLAHQLSIDKDAFGHIKTLLIGPSCGKTALVQRLVRNTWDGAIEPTLGAVFVRHALSVLGCKVTLEIWDVAPPHYHESLSPLYYRKAAVAMVTCSVFASFAEDSITGAMWKISSLREYDPKMPILLVGTLSDRGTELLAKATALAREQHVPFVVACAKTGEGVREAFHIAATLALKHRFCAESLSSGDHE